MLSLPSPLSLLKLKLPTGVQLLLPIIKTGESPSFTAIYQKGSYDNKYMGLDYLGINFLRKKGRFQTPMSSRVLQKKI